jgi:uncharacterized membrane protein
MAAKAGEMNFRKAHRRFNTIFFTSWFGGGALSDEDKAMMTASLERMEHIKARWMRRQQRRGKR